MNEIKENEVSNENIVEEDITPFYIDHAITQSNMQGSMVANNDNEISVADDLKIDSSKVAIKQYVPDNENKKEVSTPEKKKETTLQKMIRPFEILAEGMSDPNNKLYLILLFIDDSMDSYESIKDFLFIKGRQDVFDTIRLRLESGENIDVMKSLIYVDSPKVKISTRTSLYRFMKDIVDTNKVINDTEFDITDYRYDYEYEDRSEINVEEI